MNLEAVESIVDEVLIISDADQSIPVTFPKRFQAKVGQSIATNVGHRTCLLIVSSVRFTTFRDLIGSNLDADIIGVNRSCCDLNGFSNIIFIIFC